MKGKNSLELSQAAICEALQTYINLNFRLGQAPTVTKVRPSPTAGFFSVEVESNEQQREEKENGQ